jgi:hypothetical protein
VFVKYIFKYLHHTRGGSVDSEKKSSKKMSMKNELIPKYSRNTIDPVTQKWLDDGIEGKCNHIENKKLSVAALN